ncbi:MAG: cytochrome c3 family protein [Bryobacterales bacterium]|nr:cytochrome c3 family protein [Bryobacterales bacterium]
MKHALLAFLLTFGVTTASAQIQKLCGSCHTQPAEDFEKHPHSKKNVGCDTCHGASQNHIDTAGNTAPEKVAGPTDQPKLCGACHTAQRKTFEASKHAAAVMARSGKKAPACTTCHGTHMLRTATGMEQQCKRCHAQLPASCTAAPPAQTAKVSCANCHDKHTMVVAKK